MKKLLLLLCILCLLPVTAYGAEQKIPILMYHHISNDYPSTQAIVNATPDQFRAHMQVLKDNGYTSITFGDYAAYLEGRRPLPAKPVIITLDDGYTSNYEYAYPILKEMGMKATIFVVTSTVGQTPGVLPHFTWEQAREMQRSGVIDIQSHSYSHLEMDKLTPSQLQQELRLSRYDIEKNLGKPCNVLAYPYGYWNETAFRLAQQAGYTLQVKVDNGIATVGEGQTAPLIRLTVFGNWNGQDIVDHINRAG